jgi:type II secretory pathway pseudopilin PulG
MFFKNFQKGFTYVEGILAITLTLTAASAVAFGIQKSINTYKSQQLKDKAVEALIQYTEDYRMMVAYGETPFPGKQPRGENGHKVVLYDASNEREMSFGRGNKEAVSHGYLFHDIQIVRDSKECDQILGEKKAYYNIKTWIEWDDIFDKKDDQFTFRNRKNLAFEVNQAVILN